MSEKNPTCAAERRYWQLRRKDEAERLAWQIKAGENGDDYEYSPNRTQDDEHANIAVMALTSEVNRTARGPSSK